MSNSDFYLLKNMINDVWNVPILKKLLKTTMDDSFIEIYFFQLWDYLSGILLSSNKIAD